MNLTECVITSVRWLTPFRKAEKVRMWGSMKQYFDDKGISTKDYTDIEIDFWSNSWDNAAKRSAEGFKIVNVDSFHLYGNTGRINAMLSM